MNNFHNTYNQKTLFDEINLILIDFYENSKKILY